MFPPNVIPASQHSLPLPRVAGWSLTVALCAAMLTSCGGGGGGGSSSDLDAISDEVSTIGGNTEETVDDETQEPSGSDTSADDEPQIIVTTAATDAELLAGGGGMLYREYDNVVVLDTTSDTPATPTIETLRSELEFTGDEANPFLRVDRLFTVVQRNDTPNADAGIDVVGILTNVSDTTQCLVSISLESVTQTDGTTHTTLPILSPGADINGAVGGASLGNTQEDCIFPATSVYFVIEDPRFPKEDSSVYIPTTGELQSVVLAPFRSRSRDTTFRTGVLNASVVDNGAFSENIVLQNTGTFGFSVNNTTVYGIGPDGLPVYVTQVLNRNDDIELQAGETFLLTNISGPSRIDKYVVVVGYEGL